MHKRYITKCILEDLNDKKMVFVGGPRQVGKTTLARSIISDSFKSAYYYNWDNRIDRKSMMSGAWPSDTELLILDELHKLKTWKRFIKGEYDKYKEHIRFMLTGSARMDVYRKGGDSLQGRYHYFRLHPFTVAEVEDKIFTGKPFKELQIERGNFRESYKSLYTFGGFPEPFLKQNERILRRWHSEKIERMFREDILDLAAIRDVANLKLLSDILPEKVGSLLSTNAIREDLEVSFKAVAHWLNILETFYYHFRVYPFTSKTIRSIKKEPKLYLWDWSELGKDSTRMENMIASHLLKFVHYLHDYEGYRAELFFMRDMNKKEVDFIVAIDGKPWFAVEAKSQSTHPSPNLKLFAQNWAIPHCYQVVEKTDVDLLHNGIRIVSVDRFLASLV